MAHKSRSLLLFLLLSISCFFNVLLVLRCRSTDFRLTDTPKIKNRAVDSRNGLDTSSREVPRIPTTIEGQQELSINAEDSTAEPQPYHTSLPTFDEPQFSNLPTSNTAAVIRLSQFKQITEIHGQDDDSWAVFEDLSQRDGDIVFESSKTKERRVFTKRSEATFYQPNEKVKKNAGLAMAKIGMDLRDLLADSLLKNGEPDEAAVRHTLPPHDSWKPLLAFTGGWTAPTWSTFVGNVEANDNVALYGYGSTKTYHPIQYFPNIATFTKNKYEGLLGGWMPAARKVLAGNNKDDSEYYEVTVFGDTDVRDPFVVQTWHRTSHIRNGSVIKTVYGRSYPEFPMSKSQPSPEDFYQALFRFREYWSSRLSDMAHMTLPELSWVDLTKYAFVKELLVRPGGTYPKYGAIDRDYYGSEYDGFQDTFTSSLSANLEWGRFAQAWGVIDNYMTLFVGRNGSINMRGPEVGQYGLTLSLLTKYAYYTGETDLLWKHKEKIAGLATLLIRLHDESLKLNPASPGYGLIHGWSESDAALKARPDVYWQPYFANTALAIRGLRDLSQLDMFREYKEGWTNRSIALTGRLIDSVSQSIKMNKTPPYVPPMPGTNLTFRESMKQEKPSPQDWPHRLYAELLHAAVLPLNLTNMIHETMRAYGATSMGVVANVGAPSTEGRDILGFISYGYALSLLLNDRIDEFVLFLYTHRYHVHSRGSWTAGEVADITGGKPTFCIPAQLTIPSIMRWALVLEHPDDDVLYLGRGVPRAWLATGQEVGVRQAPTRWGKVDFIIQLLKDLPPGSRSRLRAQVQFASRVPGSIELKLRMPADVKLSNLTVNGRPAEIRREAVLVKLDGSEMVLNIEGS